jgi:hypothetical protein
VLNFPTSGYIESGEKVTFNIHVELNAAWQNAPEESEIKVRVFVANEINRPDHLPARLTATISTECGEEEDETQTPTATLAATATQTPGPSPPRPSSTWASPRLYNHTGAPPHPTGVKLKPLRVTYEEIMAGSARLAGRSTGLSLGQSGVPVADILPCDPVRLARSEIASGLPTGTITPTTTAMATITATPTPSYADSTTGTQRHPRQYKPHRG